MKNKELIPVSQGYDALREELKERAHKARMSPNALTTRTLEQSARGEDVHTAADVRELFDKLGV